MRTHKTQIPTSKNVVFDFLIGILMLIASSLRVWELQCHWAMFCVFNHVGEDSCSWGRFHISTQSLKLTCKHGQQGRRNYSGEKCGLRS